MWRRLHVLRLCCGSGDAGRVRGGRCAPAELTAAPRGCLPIGATAQCGRPHAGGVASRFRGIGACAAGNSGVARQGDEGGSVLEWKTATGEAETVELDRNIIQSPTAATSTTTATTAGSGAEHKVHCLYDEGTTESRFRSGSELVDAADNRPYGADRHAYCYTAQRVRSVELGGQKLELRGVASAEVTVRCGMSFRPRPGGTGRSPGFAGEPSMGQAPARARGRLANTIWAGWRQSPGQAGEQAQRPAIDLSWSRIWSLASQATASIGAIGWRRSGCVATSRRGACAMARIAT